ncbi:MAG TPA: hypothetical protein EYP53_05935 [Candidatus Latescibacteria bacterium]|nr:hypothetical protein [Candidatus Latescibacterota bacterium]
MGAEGLLKHLVDGLGGCFSSSLGIDLSGAAPEEVFKWFLAAVLFGARISDKIAANTYREFEQNDVLTPEAIQNTGWEGLVKTLDAGGYVRYDFKTATKLLDIARSLIEDYQGDLNQLHARAKGPEDLAERLQALAKGIGPVTVNIFLRELRDVWKKADPPPQELVILAAGNLGLTQSSRPRDVLDELRSLWNRDGSADRTFADFENSLLRLGKDFCRKAKCNICSMAPFCKTSKTRIDAQV